MILMGPIRRMQKPYIAAALLSFILSSPLFPAQSDSSIEQLRESFLHPPADCRILMRWWWFGPAVTQSELDRELHVMKDAGIGGVEIQPVYPLALNDARRAIENAPYLSPKFLAAIHDTAITAHNLGLRVDVTLGSGWPYGGPHTDIADAAGRLRVERVDVPEGARSVPVPAMENGETLIATFLGGQQLTAVDGGRVQIPSGLSGSDLLYFFISSRTGQQVKRSSVGAEGFVLNHYKQSAIEQHLATVGEPLLKAFGDHPPHAVFSDSLEVYGSDWTDDLLAQFGKRRGYDLTPFLPTLASDVGANTAAIRHDWAKTLTELAQENYLEPIRAWAHSHGTLFRSQAYGEPPVMLSSNRFVDLPEGEHGPYWRRFSAARWASSASHLYGRPVTSTETWTWLHSPAFRATPLDLKAEADRHFIEGINQLVGHGWPYSPPGEPEPGWRFYAAAALNDHNPWFDVMPDLAGYLQRVSFLLRQGSPAIDVAIYLPTDDAWARLRPGHVALDEMTDTLLGPVLIPAVLNAGYDFDFIDDPAIESVGIPYKVLILPGIERIPLATLQRIQAFVQHGGFVIATRSLPSLGPGLLEQKSDSTRIADLSHAMFQQHAQNTRFVPFDSDVAHALNQLLPADLVTDTAAGPSIGFVHRKLPSADLYFIANTSNRPQNATASVGLNGREPQWWNPFNGQAEPADYQIVNGRTTLPLHLAPYESRVLVFSGTATSRRSASNLRTPSLIDLSSDWNVTFPGTDHAVNMQRLRSWTTDEATRFYSGRAVYKRTVDVPEAFLSNASAVKLDFGPGTPVEPDSKETPGMHALLEGPVREAATIFVNGHPAGFIWHPPYELDVKPYLHAGQNRFEITVGNSAINEMAGSAMPDYTLLNLRYGERFVPQDMQSLKPLPSGIIGPLSLRAE